MEDSVVVASVDTMDQARDLIDELDSAGIDAELGGDQSAGELPAVAGGGIDVLVGADEADQARDHLSDARDGWVEEGGSSEEEEEPAPASLSDSEEEAWEEVKRGVACPECDSQQLGLGTPTFKGFWGVTIVSLAAAIWFSGTVGTVATGLFLFLFAIGVWMLFGQHFSLVCKECGYTGPRSDFEPDAE